MKADEIQYNCIYSYSTIKAVKVCSNRNTHSGTLSHRLGLSSAETMLDQLDRTEQKIQTGVFGVLQEAASPQSSYKIVILNLLGLSLSNITISLI